MEEKKKQTVKKNTGSLVVVQQPSKTRYSAGERITLAGLSIELDGVDITNECIASVKNGMPFPIDESQLDVNIEHEPSGQSVTVTLRRKRGLLFPILIGLLAAALAATIAWIAAHSSKPRIPEGDTGTYIIPKGDMTDEEAQAMLNEMADKSRITISIAPEMRLRDNGDLRVNLVVPEGNNGLSERLEIEQDGQIVYRSGIISPGHLLEWGSSSSAHAGAATATIYAVQNSSDFGNPISVEVNIVADGS